MKNYQWFVVIAASLALPSAVAQEAELDLTDLVRVYIEGHGHLPRNREISRKIDQAADEIAPVLQTELKQREDGDSLIAIARLATRVPDRSVAKELISGVKEKIAKIEGYSSDPLVAQNLRELERLIDGAAPLGLGEAKAESTDADSEKDAVRQRAQVDKSDVSEKEQESPKQFPLWPYALVAVALVGIVVVVLRSCKIAPGR